MRSDIRKKFRHEPLRRISLTTVLYRPRRPRFSIALPDRGSLSPSPTGVAYRHPRALFRLGLRDCYSVAPPQPLFRDASPAPIPWRLPTAIPWRLPTVIPWRLPTVIPWRLPDCYSVAPPRPLFRVI
jgi:hypothetical protein